ncbi:MAG: hypothetical protein PHR35_15075, partial [Kiritimatiellae bacterium]|nr:hypothetical protein [Kiritimatiellia bacterium]
PYAQANPTAQANGTPMCNPATPCDDYALAINVPAGTDASYRVRIEVSWPVPAADFDIYVLNPDGTAATSAASSADPEVCYVPAVSTAIGAPYTVRVVPFAPAAQSVAGTISLEAIPPPSPPPPPGSGSPPRFHTFWAPHGGGADSAGEPSIGIDWNPNDPKWKHDTVNTGGVAFFTAGLNELRVSFDDCPSPAYHQWDNVTGLAEGANTLDPIGYVDHGFCPPAFYDPATGTCNPAMITGQIPGVAYTPGPGRVFQSQLAGATSVMDFSDDDGAAWTPSQGSGIPAGADHQTVGGGPYNENAVPAPIHPTYAHQMYYCSQDVATALCARSDDGGLTFGPGVPTWNLTQCGGLHGHVRAGPDGTVYVPNKSCGGGAAVAASTDNGITWTVSTPVGSAGDTDPSIGIATDGTIYLGYQGGDNHAYVAVSHDRGTTWASNTDVGAIVGVQNAVFPQMIAGDPDRAAFAFVGTTRGGNYQDINNFMGVWYVWVGVTYDGGATWQVVNTAPNDPVQVGSICTGGTTCGGDRNLLDFNDFNVDAQGRMMVAYADGCVAPGCTGSSMPSASRSDLAAIVRQSGGRRLYHAFDPVEPAAPAAPQGVSAYRDASGVTVSWLEPDNSGSALTGYKIYRGTISGGETLLASVGTAKTSYLDAAANPDLAYFYYVTAVNGMGEGVHCGELSVGDAPPVYSPCTVPGVPLAVEPPGDQAGAPANSQLDIVKLSVAEPYADAATKQLVFTLQVADLTTTAANNAWIILWARAYPHNDPSGVQVYDRNMINVRMTGRGPVANFGEITAASVNKGDDTVTLPAPVLDTVAGTITITLPLGLVNDCPSAATGCVGAGYALGGLEIRTFASNVSGQPITQASAADYASGTVYNLIGNAACGAGACLQPPTFNGLLSVAPAAVGSSCGLKLSWMGAGAACGGPVTYDIFRSTTSSFTASAANRVATSVLGTTYQDAANLAYGTTYYYIARAVDLANGVWDSNGIEKSGTPMTLSPPDVGFSELWDEPAPPSPALPTGWTSAAVLGQVAGAWTRPAGANEPTPPPPGGAHSGSGWVFFNSFTVPAGAQARLQQVSGISLTDAAAAEVRFWMYHDTESEYSSGGDDTVQVQYSTDGVNWNSVGAPVHRYDGTQGWKEHTVGLSPAAGSASVQIGFVGISGYGTDIQLDDISIYKQIATACTMVPAVTPVPDGGEWFQGAANKAEKMDAQAGSISITWDNKAASCPNTNHNLYYGTGGGLSSYELLGSQCNIGTTGSYAWNSAPDVPPGETFLWWVLVGTDGASTESLWGKDSAGRERHGSAASGQCGFTTKSYATCPGQ